jgi:prohibitin 1
MIEPGHRGVLFDSHRGLMHEILPPGYHRLGMHERIDDFNVKFAARHETLRLVTSEGLAVEVGLSVIHRPIISELYELDAEIGPTYYDDVIGPELRSAALACVASHSFVDVVKASRHLEDEIELDLRSRISGKHVEIAGVTLERVVLPPEIANAIRNKVAAVAR